MSLTLTRMRYLVRKGLGNLTSTDLIDADVDELLNLALWDLDGRFPFKYKEYTETFSTADEEDEYDISTELTAGVILDAIRSVAVIDIDANSRDGESSKLVQVTRDWLDVNRKVPAVGEDPLDEWKGKPYAWLREQDTLIFHPIPDNVYRIVLTIWRSVPSLVSGSVNTTGLPRTWDEMVVEGAITRGHYYNQDYPLARQAENFRISHERQAVNEKTKEDGDNRYARVEVLHDWPEPEDPHSV